MMTITLNFVKGKGKLFLLVLLLFTVIYVIVKTRTLNFTSGLWNKTSSSSFAMPAFKPGVPVPPSKSCEQTKAETQRCSFHYLSPANQREGRRLMDSIAWPETQTLSEPFSLNVTTSAAQSSFTIVPQSGNWSEGDQLTVRIQMRDFNGNPKNKGGDFLIARLQNKQLGASVVGQVQDHLNGTFSAVFPLLWSSSANIEVTLVHPSESITVLKHLRENNPGRITLSSRFTSGNVSERTLCNMCLDPSKGPLCNLTDLTTGEQWFCYKPKTLRCEDRVTHKLGPYSSTISKDYEKLFQRGINLKVPIKALGDSTITILPKSDGTKRAGPGPSGYFFGNQWRPLVGPAVRPFSQSSDITGCLRGKELHMFGDSTVRQFYMFITAVQPNLLNFQEHGSYHCGPFLAVDRTNDIILTYRCHGPPIHTSADILASQLTFTANELDRLAGGPNTVVVISIWAHFAPFTLEVYYQRLVTVARAVQRLLHRAPGTNVIVRSANLRDVDTLYKSLNFSDWFSVQTNNMLRAMFNTTNVFLLDAWDMVQAYDSAHNVHPPPPIVRQMIDRILSLVCPTEGH